MRTRAIITLALVVLASCVRADDRVLIASNIDDAPSRAWASYTNAQGENLLVYLAPRSQSPTLEGAPRGQIQAVRTLGSRLPVALSALDDRAYLIYPPTYANTSRLMRVYSLRALPSPVGGLWVLDPPDQLVVEHPLVTDATLIGFQATTESPWALLESGDALTLHRLDPKGWTPVPVPDSITPTRIELSAIGTDPVLIDRSGLRFVAHRYDTDTETWHTIEHPLDIGRQTRVLAAPRALQVIDLDESGTARLRYWSDDGVFLIQPTLPELPQGAALALLDDTDSLVVASYAPLGDDPEAERTIELTEIGASSGEVLFAGAPAVSAPVSVEEFRFLVAMMILVMSGVLVVVILPDRADAMHLPEGTALADPGRRLLATLIDVFIVTSVVGATAGVSAIDIVTLAIIVHPGNAWTIFPMTIIAGVLYATSAEYLVGATPGKVIMGLRLVAAEPGVPKRPKLWRVLVRNIIKWVLPPVAALALIDPESLHRGDRTSRTLVVTRRVDEDPETR